MMTWRVFFFPFLLSVLTPRAPLLSRSDPSQGDSECRDFWFNMQALTAYLRKTSEQNPAASYYNVDVLKYQVSPCHAVRRRGKRPS